MAERATRVRYGVLALACTLSMITYLDRACYAKVAPIIAKELNLGGGIDIQWAVTAFTIAYALFEIPSGWLGDAWGPRKTLIRIVVWWSACTALTGIVGLKWGAAPMAGFGALVILRFLFGAGEAGAYPNIARALHNWFPSGESAMAQGWVWMSARLMGGLTPTIWTILVSGTAWTPALVTWRTAFVVFGLVGVAWCLAFVWFFRDHPREHARVNSAERDIIERGRSTSEAPHVAPPLGAFLRSRNLWLLCIMYFCMVYGWFFNIANLPEYAQNRFHLSEQSLLGAVFQGSPLWLGAFGCLAGGWVVDWLSRRTGDRRRTRRLVGVIAESLCAIGWIAAIFAPNVYCFFLAVSLAALANDMTLPSAWATCQDIGQRYTGTTAACMNTLGTLGATACSWVTGAIVSQYTSAHAATLHVAVDKLSADERHAGATAGYNLCFLSYALAYVVSAVCWRLIDSTKPIIPSATLTTQT